MTAGSASPGASSGSVMQIVVPLPGAETSVMRAAELLRHEIVDDVEAEPGTALRAPRGEERIEHVPLNVLRHAGAVIRERDLDLLRRRGAAP